MSYEKKEEEKPKANAPIAKIKYGGVCCDVWSNQGKDGKPDYRTFTLQKTYKLGEEWKHTGIMKVNDLPKAIQALTDAYRKETGKD